MNVIDNQTKVGKEENCYNAEQLNSLAKAVKGAYFDISVTLEMVLVLRRSTRASVCLLTTTLFQ